MEKNKVKVTRKIKKFYQRERKLFWFKISNEILNDTELVRLLINDKKTRLDKNPTWCRNISFKINLSGDDLIRNLKTVLIYYTYPKYGNL